MGKVILRELNKEFKFDHMDKRDMYGQESSLSDEIHKHLWILWYKPFTYSWPNNESDSQQQKKDLPNSGLCLCSWPQGKLIERETTDNLDLAKELKKTMAH